MSIWDELKTKAAWAAGAVGETLHEVKERTGTELAVLKAKRQIGQIDEEVEGLYTRMGKRAFELATQGSLTDPELRGLSEEIQAKKAKIAEVEAEIEKIRAEAEEERRRREEAGAKADPGETKKDADKTDSQAVWEDGDEGTPPPPGT